MDLEGKREILAVELMLEKSESTYKTLFDGLKTRGLQDVWLVVSDAHKGLAKAIRESFLGCSWQRCKVHMMRNVLAHIPSREKERFAARLKQIWLQPITKLLVLMQSISWIPKKISILSLFKF